ncbi:hypothetical protein GU243_23845 (plasmid) [Pseudarthrobacter psychrotolerans]|uniref:Enoyl-CoA hydratase/isomerase family protein n=1 Tax=Pseudarthrobacter psychrotolerans TaxID=2697569 RepID=A0A6P1NU36_9MICC|nr:enoyl-CoA hydratase/isomerase family protein [Pseudarthrobacter psychrotolerans]QHK22603.1 hypothetical protein GU243_23845 [Pseudarthrobacter psychrotolerans]
MYKETITHVTTNVVVRDGFRLALLTLDNNDPRRPVTLGPESLENLAEALKAVNPKDFEALAVTGSGPVFCAGADLKYMDHLTTAEAATNFASAGQETFGLLADLPIPTFAFINGSALGGGLELALHATYRTVASSVAALGLPEVRLGLIPAWNGIPLATALIGPTAATQLIVTDPLADHTLDPEKAEQLGIVDAVLPADEFLEKSLAFATGILKQQSQRPEPADHLSPAASPDAIRQQLDNRFRGAAPAPTKPLTLLRPPQARRRPNSTTTPSPAFSANCSSEQNPAQADTHSASARWRSNAATPPQQPQSQNRSSPSESSAPGSWPVSWPSPSPDNSASRSS